MISAYYTLDELYKSSLETRLEAMETLLTTIRSDLQAQKNSQTAPRPVFKIEPFDLGAIEPPTREEMYEERLLDLVK